MIEDNFKVVFIIPYYGKLPIYFNNWRFTALRNKQFDFLFFTDIEEIKEEDNIHVVNMSFKQIREFIQSKFDFPIELNSSYKLCDFRPAFGYIFSEYIENYVFWGHCDIDILLGDLSKFITPELLHQYDKLLEHGHMTIYRNTEQINSVFMSDGYFPEINYREVFSSVESYWFDEFFGMMLKSRRENIHTYLNPEILIDLNPRTYRFESVLTDHGELIIEWNKGHFYIYSLRDHNKWEVAYVHFQKRSMRYMKNLFAKTDHPIYIYPGSFQYRFKKYKAGKIPSLFYSLNFKYKHLKDFVKRYKTVKNQYLNIIEYYGSRQVHKLRKKKAYQIITAYKDDEKK